MADKNKADEDEVNTKKKGGNSLRNLQKSSIDKLMDNPDKLVPIPERPEEWKPKDAPEFVRFYMGSSAGAGSEVFHVYRHLRRRENIRQQYIQETAEKDELDIEFQERLAWKKLQDDQRTSKKRAKRLKKKQNRLAKKESEKSTKNIHQEGQSSPDHELNSDGEAEEPHFVIGGK